jgi:hypothetical protein
MDQRNNIFDTFTLSNLELDSYSEARGEINDNPYWSKKLESFNDILKQ